MNTAYYIDPVAGSDANSGTSTGTPWKTIGKVNTQWAAGAFGAGDSINFKAATTATDATLTLTGNSNGAAGQPIAITTYGGSTPATLTPPSGQAIAITNSQYLLIYGLTIKGTDQAPQSTTSPNYLNCQPAGISVLNTLGNGTQLAGIVVRDCEISHFVSGVTFYATVAGQTGGTIGAIVNNNHIHNCPCFGIQFWSDDSAVAARHVNPTVENNDIHDIQGFGANNQGSGTPLVPGMCTGEVVRRNRIYDSGYSDTHTSGGGPGGIVVVYSSGPGFYEDNDIDNIYSNTAGGSPTDGLGIDLDIQVSGKTVRYNRISNCGGAGLVSYLSLGNNTYCWNDLFNNNRQGGDAADFVINAPSENGTRIYNNTIRNWLGKVGLSINAPLTLTIANNVICTNGAYTAQFNTGNTVAGNRYFDANRTPQAMQWNGVDQNGLAAFRTASGQEAGTGSEGDPVLRDQAVTAPLDPRARATASNPVWTSPVIGAGLDLHARYGWTIEPRDINHNPVPASGYAVGCVAVPDRPPATSYVAHRAADAPVYANRLNAAGTNQPALIGTAGITLPGDATPQQAGPLSLDNTSGSVKFSGTDAASSAAVLPIDLSRYTRVAIEFWFYHPGGTPDRLFESEANWIGHWGDVLLQVGTIGWYPGTYKYASLPSVFTANAWNHVVAIYDAEAPTTTAQLRFMVNGVAYPVTYAGGATAANQFFSNAAMDLMMGNAGRLSEFAVYADLLPPTGNFADRAWLATWNGAFPAAADVRSGKQTGAGAYGTLVVPAAANVLGGVVFDNGTTGTLVEQVITGLSVQGLLVTIRRGAAYKAAYNDAIDFAIPAGAAWPADLTGWTITFAATKSEANANEGDAAESWAMSIVTASGSAQKIRLELTSAQTSTVAPGMGQDAYAFTVIGTPPASTDQVPLLSGLMPVLA